MSIKRKVFIDKKAKREYTFCMKTFEESLKYVNELTRNLWIDDEKRIILSDKQAEGLAKLLSKKDRDEKSEMAFIVGYIKAHAEIEDCKEDFYDEASDYFPLSP